MFKKDIPFWNRSKDKFQKTFLIKNNLRKTLSNWYYEDGEYHRAIDYDALDIKNKSIILKSFDIGVIAYKEDTLRHVLKDDEIWWVITDEDEEFVKERQNKYCITIKHQNREYEIFATKQSLMDFPITDGEKLLLELGEYDLIGKFV